MASDPAGEVAYEHPNYFRIYKDGRIDRLGENEVVPPSIDPITGVESKDVVVDPTTGVSARLYRSKFDDPSQKIWRVAFPSSSGLDDPWINPMEDPSLSKLGCSRVLVCVAGKDDLRERGRIYFKELDQVEFRGEVELLEMEEEEHVFHLFQPGTSNAIAMLKKLAFFLNRDKPSICA